MLRKEFSDGISRAPAGAAHLPYPRLAVVPVGFLIASMFSDIVYLWTRQPGWAHVSAWLVGAALAGAGLAALYRVTDLVTIRRVRAREHGFVWLGGAGVLGLMLANLLARQAAPGAAVAPGTLLLPIMTIGLLLVLGGFDGEMLLEGPVEGVERRSPTPR